MKNSEIEKTFIEMVKQNERIIYKVCSFYVSDDFSIADLYQEVVCNLWSAYSKFRGESAFSTWLYRIALNTCVSVIRKVKRHLRSVPIADLQEVLPTPEDMSEDICEMYRLIYRLGTLERAIVLLWIEGQSYQEIADVTGLTVSNVATKLKRAKEKLNQMSKY